MSRALSSLMVAICILSASPASGQVVRNIRFDREPVFTDEDRIALPWLPLGLVNRLHVDTRLTVIRRELLFAEGDTVDDSVLEETERKLRELGVFAEAQIEVSQATGDSIDVLVRTRELWTTALNIGYDRFEDESFWNLELREKNLLGSARGFEFARREDVDRDTWVIGLSDRQMIDGTWDGRLRWADSSDGNAIEWELNREFVQLTGEWGVRMRYRDQQYSPRYYVAEDLYVRPDARRTDVRMEYGQRFRKESSRVWRLLGGIRLEYQNLRSEGPLNLYTPSAELEQTVDFPDEVPEDRRWNTPYVALERKTRRFEQTRYLFAMGTQEDVPMGVDAILRMGWTARWMGSSTSGMWLNLEQLWTARLSRHWLQMLRLEGGGLLGGGTGQDLRLIARLSQYHQPLLPVTMAFGLTGGIASEMDRSDVFHLGLDSGLRAARYRELAGDRLLRGNAELRLTDTSGIFRLLTPGVVVFADFGSAWFEESRDFTWDQVRGAYGFGLRIGLNRAAADVPIRIDFAWPMLYPTEQPSPVISIATGQAF